MSKYIKVGVFVIIWHVYVHRQVSGLPITATRQPTFTSLRLKHTGSGCENEHASLHLGEAASAVADVQDSLIYVYDMPSEFTEGLTQLPVQWHPDQYDYDQVLHQHLLQSNVRTEDPYQAQLFFIPVYLGRHYNWFWQQWSTPGSAWEVHKDCLPTHTPVECFWDKWLRAKEASSNLVRKAIAQVKEHHPYWGRKDGADHFMVFSFDHGRCDMAPGLQYEEFGRMFAIQSYGDVMSMSHKGFPPLIQRWRESDYDWLGPKTWACFRPNADVLVPMYFSSPEVSIVSPFAGNRDIPLLIRFEYAVGDGKSLVGHFGHRLRYELIEQWEMDPLPHSEQGVAATEETLADMARSIFCLAPPGQTQDSVRVFRAIIKGCIPVTFYRGNDCPFERHLHMPWDAFSVNLQPDDYAQLNRVLQAILDNPKRLQELQSALAAVQRRFVWDPKVREGVLGSIEHVLRLRAAALPALGYP